MVPTEENIDVIEWVSRSAGIYLQCDRSSCSGPSYFDDEDSKHALVVVPDNKLSLTIEWSSWSKRSFSSSFDWFTTSISNLLVEVRRNGSSSGNFEDQVESDEEQVD